MPRLLVFYLGILEIAAAAAYTLCAWSQPGRTTPAPLRCHGIAFMRNPVPFHLKLPPLLRAYPLTCHCLGCG